MPLYIILISIFLSIFSTIVMSYISMATPIGPWIAPTLVLIAMVIMRGIGKQNQSKALALTTISGSVGGILATACGFSLPTLYFLDPILFAQWMENPYYFTAILGGLSLSAGGCGVLFANLFEKKLIVEEKLAFPIGQLIQKMILASNNVKKGYELLIGFIGTGIFCLFQDGLGVVPSLIPKSFLCIPQTQVGIFCIPLLRFDIWPMLWAIGFVTGHVIAIPLAVGALSKISIIDPLNQIAFPDLSNLEFVLAFCSGMVLQGAIVSFFSVPNMLKSGYAWVKNRQSKSSFTWQEIQWTELGFIALVTIAFLSYFRFAIPVQLFLIVSTFACAYQVAVIAGKIGLAPLGRFATFVMVPAMLFFSIDSAQIVLIATFVEICTGVTADILFGRKIAHLSNIDRKEVLFYQYLGLVVSSITIGIIFWILINNLGLGSPQLFAYKAQSRRLLINAQEFNVYAMIFGAIFSYILAKLKINPMLVLGGLLMPFNISIGLIFGGLLTSLVRSREEWEPFWSGVFASNSIWMLIHSMAN